MPPRSTSGPAAPREGYFATTHWSLILATGNEESTVALEALEQLCRAYWYPLYAYIRRTGRGPEEAQDLTQDFFHHLLRSNWIARADPARGRFRSFLLGGLQNFLANDWQKSRRLKRGGNLELIQLDALEAEERYRIEPADTSRADKIFERRWAMTLLERVLARLEAEQRNDAGGVLDSANGERAGMESGAGSAAGARFQALRGALVGEPNLEGYAALARQFSVTESTVKSWVRRLRRRYCELLRDEVAQTVGTAREVQEELQHLFRVLAS